MATTTARLEQQTGMKGFFVSVILHAAILALLFFVTIYSPTVIEVPPPIIFDFGETETGSGDDPAHFAGGSSDPGAASAESPSPAPPSQPVTAVTPVKTQSKTIVSEDPEAVALKKQKQKEAELQKQIEIKKQKDAAAAAAKAAEEKKIKDQMASVFNKGKTGNGSGSGSGTGSGTGTGTSTGSGPGNGEGNGGPGNQGDNNLYVTGRKWVNRVQPFNSTNKEGKVVVSVKVDRQGNIISAKAGASGTNTTDSYLWGLAEAAAKKSKLTVSTGTAEEQWGTIVYNFINTQ